MGYQLCNNEGTCRPRVFPVCTKMQFLEFVHWTRARPAQSSPRLLLLPQFPACIPLLQLLHSCTTPALLCRHAAVQPRCRPSTQLSSTAFPSPIPGSPTSVNFAHCCTGEQRAGILIKGYTPSFSPPFAQPPPCQADKKPPLIKRGSKLPGSFLPSNVKV